MSYTKAAEFGFIVLSIICIVLIFQGIKVGLRAEERVYRVRILKQYLIGVVLWIVILSALSLSGFIANFDSLPPRLLLVLIVPIVTLLLIMRSKALKIILNNIPLNWIPVLQSFRIVVEIFIWFLWLDRIIPIQMTFEGRNLDILVGITGPMAAWLFFRKERIKKWAAILWNVFGMVLLLNIVVVALLSAPTPLRVFMNEPANTIVATFPSVFLPGVLVTVAYYGHIFSIKQVLSHTKTIGT